ncbi:MAG: RrF2 family transcriptional regulator [Tractidigestivibacter sp.]|jgi:Rrf2 family protein|uniref:RrF2 family transcriptional regulator n=1 Tax=Tractidigestivibacter sp. TaxID=2847320 RepID=UPI003D936ED5
MEISRKTDYALRMISALVRSGDGVVSVRSAAEENGIPYSFARSIQHDLAQNGIVESVRGAHGGMRLAVDPKTTSLLQIVEAVQGPVIIATCDYAGPDGSACPFKPQCRFNPVWCNAERMLHEYFSSVTLYQIVVDGLMPRMTGGFELVNSREVQAQEVASAKDDEAPVDDAQAV